MTVYQKPGKVKRPYRSPRRQAQAQATRTAIVEAAGRLFVEQGYAQTSVREIAKAAGVAEPTIYATLGDKASVAKAAAEMMADRVSEAALPGLEDQLRAEPRMVARARLVARTSHLAYRSGAVPLRDALVVGAASDPRLAEVVEELMRSSRQTTAWLVDLVAGDRLLTPAARDRAIDVVWAVSSSSVHRRLVESCAWTPEEYEDWLTLEIRRAIRMAGARA